VKSTNVSTTVDEITVVYELPGIARWARTIRTASPARAGTFARGEFELGRTSALTLPQSAVVLRDGFAYVFLVNAENKVVQNKVAVGRRVGERVEVVSGLAATDRVVESGAGFLADGDTVRVVESAAPAGTTAQK